MPSKKPGNWKRIKNDWKSFYTKDAVLWAQRVTYTLSGMSWEACPCAYCGDPATHEDHVYPIASFAKLYRMGAPLPPDEILLIVPACRECNMLAGDRVFYTFEGKRGHIKEKLFKRYKRVMSIPYWDPEEIAELRGNLQRYVGAGATQRDIMLERLRY